MKKSKKGGNKIVQVLQKLMVPTGIMAFRYGARKLADTIKRNKKNKSKKNKSKSKKTRKRILLTVAS